MSARMFFARSLTPPLGVTAPDIFASHVNSPPGNYATPVSGNSVAEAFGGIPPYTFAWAAVPGTANGDAIAYTGTATAQLTATRNSTPGTSTQTMRVTVSDAASQIAILDIGVHLELFGDFL